MLSNKEISFVFCPIKTRPFLAFWKVVGVSGAGQTCYSDTGRLRLIEIIFPFRRTEPGERFHLYVSTGVGAGGTGWWATGRVGTWVGMVGTCGRAGGWCTRMEYPGVQTQCTQAQPSYTQPDLAKPSQA